MPIEIFESSQLIDIDLQPLAPAISTSIDFYSHFYQTIQAPTASSASSDHRAEGEITKIYVNDKDIDIQGTAENKPQLQKNWGDVNFDSPNRLVFDLTRLDMSNIDDEHIFHMGHAIVHFSDIEVSDFSEKSLDEFFKIMKK